MKICLASSILTPSQPHHFQGSLRTQRCCEACSKKYDGSNHLLIGAERVRLFNFRQKMYCLHAYEFFTTWRIMESEITVENAHMFRMFDSDQYIILFQSEMAAQEACRKLPRLDLEPWPDSHLHLVPCHLSKAFCPWQNYSSANVTKSCRVNPAVDACADMRI